MDTSQMVVAINDRMRVVDDEIQTLQRLQRTLGADVATQKSETEPAWNLLAELLVPDLAATSLQSVAARLHLPALLPAAVIERRNKMLLEAQQRLHKLQTDQRVVTAEQVLNEVDIGVSELEVSIAPLSSSTALLEADAMFSELLAWRYGTDEYEVRFWQMNFYRHWQHGDMIVEVHGPRLKKLDFKGIAAQYVEEKAALQTLIQSREVLLDKKRGIEALRRMIVETQTTIRDIDVVTLSNARSRVKDHLRQLDQADVFALLHGDDAAILAFKRIVGLGKKQEYLSTLADQQVKASLGELHQLKNKLTRNAVKLSRPKNLYTRWSGPLVEQMLGKDRTDKWQKRRTSWNDARTNVVGFHAYDRWDPVRDVLWWDVMTDGRLDGNFIEEVRLRGPRAAGGADSSSVQSAWRSDDLGDIS